MRQHREQLGLSLSQRTLATAQQSQLSFSLAGRFFCIEDISNRRLASNASQCDVRPASSPAIETQSLWKPVVRTRASPQGAADNQRHVIHVFSNARAAQQARVADSERCHWACITHQNSPAPTDPQRALSERSVKPEGPAAASHRSLTSAGKIFVDRRDHESTLQSSHKLGGYSKMGVKDNRAEVCNDEHRRQNLRTRANHVTKGHRH